MDLNLYVLVAEHATDDHGIKQAPVVIADAAPGVVVKNYHLSYGVIGSIDQLHIRPRRVTLVTKQTDIIAMLLIATVTKPVAF